MHERLTAHGGMADTAVDDHARPDPTSFIRGYKFKSSPDAKAILIPPELITYSHSVNLFDVRDGLSFLAAADTEIRADLAASIWNLNFFDDNNGVPDGLVSVGKDTLDPDLQMVRSEIRDFFGGTKRGIAVARSGDLDYKEFGRSQKDMEFSQGSEFASKVIGRTLGFPDGYWSDLANRANAEQARAQ
jgi:phage portal protein BeeE